MSPFKLLRRFTRPFSLGGDERDRTDDPLLAKQVLSQLSYTPVSLKAFTLKIKQQELLDSRVRPFGLLTLKYEVLRLPFSIERR